MRFLMDLTYMLAAVGVGPKFLYRMFRHGRYRAGWDQRLGRADVRRQPNKKCIWLHAVSVGEVNASRTLVDLLKDALPEYEIVISATTDTGFARAKAVFGADFSVFYFPFDLSFVMRRAFARIRPDAVLLMELEVWPNLVQIAGRAGAAVVVVNGRISDRSFPRYKLVGPLVRRIFSKVTLVLAQTEEYARRFRHLGCPPERVMVTGSLKYDTAQVARSVDGAQNVARQINLGEEPLLVAGGTGPGEEKIVLDVFGRLRSEFADLRVAIVPRKPERFDEAAELIKQAGFDFVRYSELKRTDGVAEGRPPVILGDTMGDLRKFYSLARVIFVGRSLVPMGGSDMMEATALGRFTIFGPHTFNFRQTVQALLAGGGAIEVRDADGLYDAIRRSLSDTDYAGKVAHAGRDVIRKNQGATERSVEAICRIVGVSPETKAMGRAR